MFYLTFALIVIGVSLLVCQKRNVNNRAIEGLGMILALVGVGIMLFGYVEMKNVAYESGYQEGLKDRASLDTVQRSVKAAYTDGLPKETVRGQDIDGEDPRAK